MGVSQALSGQQVLPLWQEKRLLSPSESCALAQHSDGLMVVSARFARAGFVASVLALKHVNSVVEYPKLCATL